MYFIELGGGLLVCSHSCDGISGMIHDDSCIVWIKWGYIYVEFSSQDMDIIET